MPITLRQLEIFLALAEHEHTSRAARAVHLSQSAVSMALAELEKQLGEPLFDRTGQGLRLNSSGRRLRARAHDVLLRADEVETLFTSEEVAGRLHVGASSTIGIYVLPEIVAAFTARHPQAAVRLEIGNTRQVRDRVLSHTLDLGFVEGPAWHSELETAPWRSDELVVFCSATHPLASEGRLDPARVEEVRWVLREEGSGTRAVFEQALGEDVGRLRYALELGHSEAVRRAVEAGAGVGCLSRLVVQDGLRRGTLAALSPPQAWDLKRTLWRVIRRASYVSRLRTAFVEACNLQNSEESTEEDAA